MSSRDQPRATRSSTARSALDRALNNPVTKVAINYLLIIILDPHREANSLTIFAQSV
jgi:hypothetical protein